MRYGMGQLFDYRVRYQAEVAGAEPVLAFGTPPLRADSWIATILESNGVSLVGVVEGPSRSSVASRERLCARGRVWETVGMQTPDDVTPPVETDDAAKFDWNGQRPIEIIARWLIKGPLIVINLLTGGGGSGSDR